MRQGWIWRGPISGEQGMGREAVERVREVDGGGGVEKQQQQQQAQLDGP